MSQRPDENGQLTSLLQALAAPEPSEEFLTGARRRYLEAIASRERRAVFTGLAAAVVGLVVIATLLATTVEPAALVAWLAEAMADLARERDHPPAHHSGFEAPRRRGARSGPRGRLAPGLVR